MYCRDTTSDAPKSVRDSTRSKDLKDGVVSQSKAMDILALTFLSPGTVLYVWECSQFFSATDNI
jgi:hypothetical protein